VTDKDDARERMRAKLRAERMREAQRNSSDATEVVEDENFELDFSSMKSFVTSLCPRQVGTFECYIERKKSGFKSWSPEYFCFAKDGHRFLLAAKKRKANRTSNYAIAWTREGIGGKDSPGYIGKVRSNFVGTEFVAYDTGINPKDAEMSSMEIRKELACVRYETNVMGTKGPRKMTVALPRVDAKTGKAKVFQPYRKSEGLTARMGTKASDCIYLMNKPPRWSESVGAYVLNFNGRVTMASVKNFQLVADDDHETVLLQFGRVGKNKFSMDFRWPLTPLQAFAICLTSFDYKLACE